MVLQNENKKKKKTLTSPTMSSNSRSLSSSPLAVKKQQSLKRKCLFHAHRGDSERRALYGCYPPERLVRATIRHEARLKLQNGVLLRVSKAVTNKHIFAFTGVDIPYLSTKKRGAWKYQKKKNVNDYLASWVNRLFSYLIRCYHVGYRLQMDTLSTNR